MDAVIRPGPLALRPSAADGADALFGIFRQRDVARGGGPGAAMTHRDQAVQRIGRFPGRAGDHPATGIWAVVDDDTDVCRGQVMLVPLPPSAGVDRADVEVGWHLHPDVWGRGYASEAAAALVERGFAAGIEELYAVTDPDNVRSQAVCRRLGMTDLGLRTEWYDQQLRAFRLSR
jgi:RimJ/RimL family protein N-acetyltransferase